MKKTLFTVALTVVATLLLFGDNRISTPIEPGSVEAQAIAKKTALIAAVRQDATDFTALRARVRQHRATFDALGISWVNGDFVGTDSGITAAQFTTSVTNMGLIFNAYDSGGTLSSGFPATIEVVSY